MSIKLANYKSSYSIICLTLMIILWCINACCVAIVVNQPTAIDVYKGKTELQRNLLKDSLNHLTIKKNGELNNYTLIII